ncbi:DUF6626 family protein [Azospirillum soli]|uniref:DUF6626 family protein n=1 Tax=Azospirillum soli TaxID=1304799 RepID=UPI003CCE5589
MLNQIYNVLVSERICSSQVEFSRVWLGSSSRYYSNVRATGRQPSIQVLTSLALRLERLAATLAERNPRSATANRLRRCADTVWGNIDQRSLCRTPRRRTVRSASVLAQIAALAIKRAGCASGALRVRRQCQRHIGAE